MKKIIMMFSVILILSILGCSSQTNYSQTKEYDIALMYNGENSQLNLIKGNIEDKVMIKKGYLSSEEYPIIYNKKHNIVLSVEGYGGNGECDETMVGTNLETKENTYYYEMSETCGIAGIATKDDYIYTTGNNDGVNYITMYNINTKKKNEKASPGFVSFLLAITGNKMIFSKHLNENPKPTIGEMDLGKLTEKNIKLNDKENEVMSISVSDKKVYIFDSPDNEHYLKAPTSYIYSYDLASGKKEKIDLKYPFVNKVKYYDGKVYISHSDFMTTQQINRITVYNEKTKKLKIIKTDGTPKQLEASNNKLYVYTEYIDTKKETEKQISNGDTECNKSKITVYDIINNYKVLEEINPYSKDKEVKNMCFASFVSTEK